MTADYGDQAKYKANPYNIDKDKVITAEGMRRALGTKEEVENKQQGTTDILTATGLTSVQETAADDCYPSSLLVGANLDMKVSRTGDTMTGQLYVPSKNTAAGNNPTYVATEAQVYMASLWQN